MIFQTFHGNIKKILFISALVCFSHISQDATCTENISQNKSLTNSLGMKFVLIQPGKFMMGSNLSPTEIKDKYGGEAKWYSDETPQHEVTITRPYYIQTTEVTQGQWKAVMGFNPSGLKNCGKNCPVEKVSWHDVEEFIKRLNQKEEADTYRLPTEAEWEYACRAGSVTEFCFGEEKNKLDYYAWHNSNSDDWTHHVHRKRPNAWGIYDMHGNVWEWCQDWYSDYPSEAVTDPIGPSSGSHRVSRGGSWRSAAMFCRSPHRYGVDPSYRRPNRGFRLVKNF
jgi:formylglycine-generating enzyme required for sulfatase activity